MTQNMMPHEILYVMDDELIVRGFKHKCTAMNSKYHSPFI